MNGGTVDLAQQVWSAPLRDRHAPEQALVQALSGDASYDLVLADLRALWRMGLPGIRAAEAARARWPGSIDMAVLACDLRVPVALDADLEHLRACVLRQNRRRAAYAGACLRAGRPELAQVALAAIDPASPTALDDRYRRADIALALSDFDTACEQIEGLQALGRTAASGALRLRLIHQRDGAQAFAAALAALTAPSANVLAQGFDLAISESDFDLAPDTLARWQACPDANQGALARARTRLALERSDGEGALALLKARLDMAQPWAWAAVDHVQWLRAGQIVQTDPPALLAHARAACRLHARHDWLYHMFHSLREAVEDWDALAHSLPAASAMPQRALIASRAALRLGLVGRAAVALAPARRNASQGAVMSRLYMQRAEIFWLAGRLRAAWAALGQARQFAQGAGTDADIGILAAEIALTKPDPETAANALRPAARAFPRRMSVTLTEARIAFARGAFADAMDAHARFNDMKRAQTGTLPAPDVRDLIVADAFNAARGIDTAFARDQSITTSLGQVGAERIAASAGLSACLLNRARETLVFVPDTAATIPHLIVHYWQGPPGPALVRAQRQWARLHPECRQRVFDDAQAEAWLQSAYGPDMAARFGHHSQPAVRADLFRACWIYREGGIFTDLDEYPRVPVLPWLQGARAVLCIERGFGTIANNFIAAVPDHPLCGIALDHVCTALDGCDTPYAWWHSGPAQWTRAAFAHYFVQGGRDVRFLSQAQYCRRVATNLPYPHKRSPEHWR